VRIVDTDPPEPARETTTRPIQVLVVDRPDLTEQHDTTVNVTSLTTFGICPRRYYLQRYIGWSTGRPQRFDPEELPRAEEEPGDANAAELGTMVHELLAGKPGTWPARAVQLASVFTASPLGWRAERAPRVEREWDFIAEVAGTLVRGTVDLWFRDDEGQVIVDYKTDDVTGEQARLRAADYAPQLALYAIALGKSRAFLHFLRPNVVVEVPVDAAAQEHVRSLIAGLREAQNDLRFDLQTGEHCQTCSFYRGMCPAGFPEASGGDEMESPVAAE
jgi:CRISPR/Cas system-associated exonuclease Cas4 (RecB family)